MHLTAVPVLPVAVRNIVIARATAGAYDPTETPHKAIEVCRRAARERMGMLRLNPTQAAAVDALVIEVRVAAHDRGSFSLDGRTMVLEPRPLQLQAASAPSENGETMKAILAALLRLEKLFAALIALAFGRNAKDVDAAAAPAFAPSANVRQIGAGARN